jgi:hypothetical protein
LKGRSSQVFKKCLLHWDRKAFYDQNKKNNF